MLFLPHKPTHLLIEQHHKLILTTQHQILFTTLHFLEEYLIKELPQSSPTHLAYCSKTSEALVATKTSILLYWTDWQHRLELLLSVALNQERIYSFDWDQKWTVFGEFKQYSPKKVTLEYAVNYDEDLPTCFVGQIQYLLTNKRIVSYDHRSKKRRNVDWEDAQKWITKLKGAKLGKTEIKAIKTEKGSIAMSVGNLCLIISGDKVIRTFEGEGELSVDKEIAVWHSSSRMKIHQIVQTQLISLGDIETFEGQYYGSTIFESKLCMFFYDFKELHMKTLRLVDQTENILYQKLQEPTLKQKQSKNMEIDEPVELKAMPESSKSCKSSVVIANFQSTTHEDTSPLILEADTKQSLLAHNMQVALKASLGKFQQQLQRSFEQQKFNDEIEKKIEQNKAVVALPEVLETVQREICEQIDLNSLGVVSEQARSRSGEGLINQAESGFEWQQMEQQHYEQQFESPDMVNQLNPHLISSSSHPNEYAETPAFQPIEHKNGDSWVNFQNQWTNNTNVKEPKEPERSFVKMKISQQIIKDLQKKKYTHILSEIYRKENDRFEEALDSMVDKVIQQPEARIFFAQHIRILNPDLSKDRLLRLYRHIEDTSENKKYMGNALSEFKLYEVPFICLPFEKELLKIFQKIYPSVYIEDLMQPTIRLFQELLQSYFAKNYKEQVIYIEDERIQLAHPRNILNILLYLNQCFKLPLVQIFDIYAKKMLRHGQIQVLKRLMESKVFQICEVDKSIFEKAAQQTARELLEQSTSNFVHVQQILVLMDAKTRKHYNEVLNLNDFFNSCSLTYSIGTIIELPINKNSFNFMNDLINNSPAFSLSKVNLSSLFKMISRIQDGKSANYYTNNHIKIVRLYAERLMEAKYCSEAISSIVPVCQVISKGFIAALLFKHLSGKYANRLVGMASTPEDLAHSFREILSGKTKNIGDFPPSTLPMSDNLMNWGEFRKFCEQQMPDCPWQLSYILFTDSKLSRDLMEEGVIKTEHYHQMLKKLGHTTQDLRHVSRAQIKVEDLYIPLLIGSDSHKSNETVEINPSLLKASSKGPKKLAFQRSLKAFEIRNEEADKLCRSLLYNQVETDPTLVTLKLSVERQQILKMLSQIYQQSPRDQFLRAFNVVDKERIGLYNIDNYRSLVMKNIAYPFERLIPFSYFLNEEQAWRTTQAVLRTEITTDNFWLLYVLIDYLYGKADKTVIILVEKIIFYERKDQWAPAITDLLEKNKIPAELVLTAAEAAAERELFKIQKALRTYLKKLD